MNAPSSSEHGQATALPSQPPAAGLAAQTLPATLRLMRSHPDDETRLGLLELVAHDHNTFGYEDALFFAAKDGSARAFLAQACVDRYNSHASLLAENAALRSALKEARDDIEFLRDGDAGLAGLLAHYDALLSGQPVRVKELNAAISTLRNEVRT